MDPRDLVSSILAIKERTPSRFLVEHGLAKLQPTFSRWLSRQTKDPRAHWTVPVAKALGIKPAALHDEAAADEEAMRLGLLKMPPAAASLHALPARRPRQARIDAGVLALQLADLMRGFEQDIRDAAAPLFKIAATQPERGGEVAEKLRQLLAEPPSRETTAA